MRATFALLLDGTVRNFISKLALEIHQKYHIGFAGVQLPPHVSLKQPFQIDDLPAVESYFDELADRIDPFVITLPRIGGPDEIPILWLEVEETAILRELHTRINRELAARLPHTQALFDGPAYHFHATVAAGGQSAQVYKALRAEFASCEVALQTLTRSLALFYYDDDQGTPGNFFVYKVLPLGQR